MPTATIRIEDEMKSRIAAAAERAGNAWTDAKTYLPALRVQRESASRR